MGERQVQVCKRLGITPYQLTSILLLFMSSSQYETTAASSDRYCTAKYFRENRVLKFAKKMAGVFSAAALVSGLLTGPALAKDSSKPIVIPTHNWSSQVVMAYVIGGIFKSMGNNVKYVPADSQAVYEAIRVGNVTLSHEIWQAAFGKSFQNAVDKGGVLDWGTHSAPTLEEMGVPNWVIEKGLCPGLPKWEALKKCHKNFVTPDSGGKGRWLDGPQSWHKDLVPTRVKALGLADKWVVKFSGGADALWAELAAAKREGRGTVIFNWSPNWTDAEGFTFIEFPTYKDGCRKVDGGDGACGSPIGWLKKAVNVNFPKTHPKAAAMFKKLSFSTKDIGQMAALVDLNRMSHEDAAKKWLADHKDVWQKFLPTGTAKKSCPGSYKPTWDNCTGTRTFRSGSKYVGGWKTGKQHGLGTLTYADGEKYVGGFRDGLHHGEGTITNANGKTLKGIWENDKFKSARD